MEDQLIKAELGLDNANINTRGNIRMKFKLMSKCTSKYLNSPLYRGATLWDRLDKNVQDLPSVKEFTARIMESYKVYGNLIDGKHSMYKLYVLFTLTTSDIVNMYIRSHLFCCL